MSRSTGRSTQDETPVPGRELTEEAKESRFRLLRQERRRSGLETLADDARSGLAAARKQLPPKYFYDARGSQLFEQITRLPEYYQTEAERKILERVADPLVAELRPRALVEFGSGSADKTRVLLDTMDRAGLLEGFGPFDVSESALVESAERLLARYPGMDVVGVLGDFERPRDLPFADRIRIVAFLGSTIGNLTRQQAVDFLRQVAEQLGPEDGFLIGFDLVKDRRRLEAAYNDAQGMTRAFNLNVLKRPESGAGPGLRSLHLPPPGLLQCRGISHRAAPGVGGRAGRSSSRAPSDGGFLRRAKRSERSSATSTRGLQPPIC